MKRNNDKERRITLMLMPDGHEWVKQISISEKILKYGATVLIVALVFVLTISLLFVRDRRRISDYQKIREQKRVLEHQVGFLSKKVDNFNTSMSNLRRFDHKLRALLNLNESSTYKTYGDVGEQSEGELPENISDLGVLDDSQQITLKKMYFDIDNLEFSISMENERFNEIDEFLFDQKSLLFATPSIWPAYGWITSGFGVRRSPFSGVRTFHKGLDISGQIGNNVIATADGIVVYAGLDSSYGNVVTINHGYGVATHYAHLQAAKAHVGQRVRRGDIIGLLGNTGRSTGPHVHYEVRVNGIPVNPLKYILNR